VSWSEVCMDACTAICQEIPVFSKSWRGKRKTYGLHVLLSPNSTNPLLYINNRARDDAACFYQCLHHLFRLRVLSHSCHGPSSPQISALAQGLVMPGSLLDEFTLRGGP